MLAALPLFEMSLSTIANLIRLKVLAPTEAQPRFSPVPVNAGRTLLTREVRPVPVNPSASGPAVGRQTLVVGLDFGARQTRVVAVVPEVAEFYLRRGIPSAVAVHTPDDEKTLSPYLHFGAAALNKGPRFQVFRPWQNGDIADPMMARELARHVRDLMRRSEALVCRAVVAEPVVMSSEGRHHFRQALRGLFEEVVFLPRPYLAGLELREQLRTATAAQTTAPSGLRPVLLVDLGAGSTEICRLGEQYPRPSEMAGVGFGGDHVVSLMQALLRQEYPSFQPSQSLVLSWLENFGFVGEPVAAVAVKVPVDGVEREIVLTNSLRRSCEAWLIHVQQMIMTMARDGIGTGQRPVQVFLTGGGSRMNRLIPVLNEWLTRGGIGGLNSQLAEESDLSLAVMGALRAARRVRTDQWPRFALT